MVRDRKIKQLIAVELADKLIPHMAALGFKYSRTKVNFIRQQGLLQQVFSLSYVSCSVYYDEPSDKLYFSFRLYPSIEVPKFDKWYTEQTGEGMLMQYHMDSIYSSIELPFDALQPDDFYQPVSAQGFKKSIANSLAGANVIPEQFFSFEDLISQGLPNQIAAMDKVSDIKQFYEILPHKYDSHYTLLIFGGYRDEARALFDASYQHHINIIEEYQSTDPATAVACIGYLDIFIAFAQRVLHHTYTNPFTRMIKVKDNKQETLNIGPALQFKECLRFDTGGFKITDLRMNATGDVLIIEDSKNISKYNIKGELVFEKTLSAPDGFYKSFHIKTGCLPEIGAFYANNYIIDQHNNCLELPLPKVEKPDKYGQRCDITDLAYLPAKDQYLLLYENWFITYNSNGSIEKKIEIEGHRYNRIVAEKQWIVTHKHNVANTLLNFEGEKIKSYPYANGNHKYTFSHSKNQFISYFYSSKSQYYDLQSGREENFYAHPTYLRDYKETMYDDIHHNFGLTIAAFSPDDQYITGCADHGKYVAWKLPSLERTELIPLPAVIDMLSPHTYSTYKDGVHTDHSYKPTLVEFEGQTYLKNRGNDADRILFFDKGDLFVMLLENSIALVWNRQFKNVGGYKTTGSLHWQADKYLTQQLEKEIVVYTRV